MTFTAEIDGGLNHHLSGSQELQLSQMSRSSDRRSEKMQTAGGNNCDRFKRGWQVRVWLTSYKTDIYITYISLSLLVLLHFYIMDCSLLCRYFCLHTELLKLFTFWPCTLCPANTFYLIFHFIFFCTFKKYIIGFFYVTLYVLFYC